MTYKQAEQKIFDAYFKDEIEPLSPRFCFCGTLCDNRSDWFGASTIRHYDFNGYSGEEFLNMEHALIRTIQDKVDGGICSNYDNPLYEEALFEGMSAALDVLKKIHENRGEDVDEIETKFSKRELLPNS